MKKRLPFLIVAACIACSLIASGCGRNAAPSNTQQRREPPQSSVEDRAPVTAPVVQDNRPVIVTFGDSLTAGVAGRSYPEYLQDLLNQNGYSYRVDNQGISGDTTTDGLARIENVISEHPALVLLEFGGNDGLRGIPVDATQQNLGEMITRLKQANIPTVLLGITLPPNYGPDYVKPFTAMFPALAKKYHLKLFPFLLVSVYKSPELMQPDGIHPNGRGNEVVARDVFSFIKSSLPPSARK